MSMEQRYRSALRGREPSPRWLMQPLTNSSFIRSHSSSSKTVVMTGRPSRSSRGVSPPALPADRNR